MHMAYPVGTVVWCPGQPVVTQTTHNTHLYLPHTITSPPASIEALADTSPCTITLPGASTCSSSRTDLLMYVTEEVLGSVERSCGRVARILLWFLL